MSYHKEMGERGERIAQAYLEENGFLILKKNYRFAGGEVDLIAKTNTELHFIEVKFRTSHTYGSGLDAVDFIKQKKISRAAQLFVLKDKKLNHFEKVFSVLNIREDENKTQIDFFSDAFEFWGESF